MKNIKIDIILFKKKKNFFSRLTCKLDQYDKFRPDYRRLAIRGPRCCVRTPGAFSPGPSCSRQVFRFFCSHDKRKMSSFEFVENGGKKASTKNRLKENAASQSTT